MSNPIDTPAQADSQKEIFITKDIPSLLKHVGTPAQADELDSNITGILNSLDISWTGANDIEKFEHAIASIESLIQKAHEEAEIDARIDELDLISSNYWTDDDTDTLVDELITPYIDKRLAELKAKKEVF